MPSQTTSNLQTWTSEQVCARLSEYKQMVPAVRAFRKRGIGGRSLTTLSASHFSRMDIPTELHSELQRIIRAISDGTDSSTQLGIPITTKRLVSTVSRNTRRVAIIGTAGRAGPPPSLNLFNLMKDRALHIISKDFSLDISDVHLISGGAAFGDHVSVSLFKSSEHMFSGITLFLPCAWSTSTSSHCDSGHRDWKQNPGRSANRYHRAFLKHTGINSLHEINSLVGQISAEIDTSGKGFHDRNSKIANAADMLIAFTWSKSSEPPKGGTRDTWDKARLRGVKCVHVSLNDLR